MNRILRAPSVAFVALVTTAACGRVDEGAPTGAGGGYANEGGVAVGAGAPPSSGAIALDAGPSPSAGASLLGCPDAGDAAATVASNFVAVSVGDEIACALTVSGAVQCWGSTPIASGSAYPATIPGLESGATAISAGYLYACALVNGAAQCWGYNENTSSVSPVTVVPGLESGIVAVSVGTVASAPSDAAPFSACAVTASGAVQCWGDNTYGQLGNGSSGFSSNDAGVVSHPSKAVPVPVTGLDNGVTAISVGGVDACAVTAGGAVQCWGDNTYGQLGVDPMALAFSAVPVTVPGLTSGVTAVSVGDRAACALTAGGQVTCWGNAWGTASGFIFQVAGPWGPVPIAGLSGGVTAVSVTGNDGCAVTTGAGVMCWGDDVSLGNVYPPMTVAGLESGATAIAVGGRDYSISACAVTGDGRVECWAGLSVGITSLPTPFGLACAYENVDAGGNTPDSADSSTTGCADPLTFADPYVEANVREAIGVPSGPIHPADVAGLTDLEMLQPPGTPSNPPPGYVGPVTSLDGIQCLWNLRTIYFEAYFVDLTPLSDLPNLTVLSLLEACETTVPRLPQVTEFLADLHSNTADWLAALPSLRVLRVLNSGALSTAQARAALSAMTGLATLSVPGAGLTDTAPLAALSLLTDVDLSGNQIQDISSLSALANLRSLDLSNNLVTDLSPLVANVSLGHGTGIAIGGNPIDCLAQAQNIATLRARGVTLTTDCP
jgi:Leucine Rich Repeat (LRR) protein/regulator of chromosome condensation (RCC1) repeat-containing protein